MRLRSFVRGVQTGISATLEISEGLTDLGDVFADQVILCVNGTDAARVEADAPDRITVSAPDTLTVTDGTVPEAMPAYTMLPVNAVAGKTIDLNELLVCSDPRVKVKIDLTQVDEVFRQCFSYDAEENTLTTVYEPVADKFTPDPMLYYRVNFDADGDDIPEIADAILLIRFVSEDSALTKKQRSTILKANTDQNGDGLVTLADVSEVLRKLGAQ